MKVKVSNVAFSKNSFLIKQLLSEFPDAEINDKAVRLKDDALVNYFSGAEGVIVGLEQISSTILDQLHDLKIIAKYGVGLDNIDLNACKERKILVGWTPGVNKRSVAEMTLGFMLSLTRNLYSTSNQLKEMIWNKSGGSQLTGKTIGIIGIGNIGKELIELIAPFNCRILINDIIDVNRYASANNLEIVTKSALFKEADIISIHTPFTPQTSDLVDLAVLTTMKSTAYLINTARGGIINEADLKFSLQNNIIAGAALDVYQTEPPPDKDLLSLPNLICTPHTGGNAYEAVVAMGMSALNHLINYRDKKLNEPI